MLVDRFGRSLQFCYLEFDKEAISDGCRSENPGIGGGFLILSELPWSLWKLMFDASWIKKRILTTLQF